MEIFLLAENNESGDGGRGNPPKNKVEKMLKVGGNDCRHYVV